MRAVGGQHVPRFASVLDFGRPGQRPAGFKELLHLLCAGLQAVGTKEGSGSLTRAHESEPVTRACQRREATHHQLDASLVLTCQHTGFAGSQEQEASPGRGGACGVSRRCLKS